MYQRGLYETTRDLVVIGGKIGGYLAVLKDVWMAEYERYSEAQNVGGPGVGRGMGGGRGRSSGR